jgi:hypothetical protein
VGEYTWMEGLSEAEMMRPWEKRRQVITDVPCAGNDRRRGSGWRVSVTTVIMKAPTPGSADLYGSATSLGAEGIAAQ